jgi:peptidoglycan-N-acetylglucosamine deacetylase
VRRRRAGALVAIGGVVVLFTLIASGGGHPTRAVSNSVRRGSPNQTAKGRTSASDSLLARENSAIDRLLSRQPFIASGGGERREIALTFDDGPGPYTPRLLDQLQRLHAPATFFEVGFMISYFHASLQRELRMGLVIGDHTELHPMMARLTNAGQEREILLQTDRLGQYGAAFPRLYRPPYGSFNAATFRILNRLHMLMVLWSDDTDDYLRPGVDTIVQRALAGAKPGAIILMHDAGGTRTQTIAALPQLVHALRARGYTLVTIPQLILDDPPRGTQPTPTSLAGD